MLDGTMRAVGVRMVCRFEDLEVWQDAKEQCDRIGELLKRPGFRADPELSGQFNAAGISVINNVSEGFVRRRDKEFAQFLRYAAGRTPKFDPAYTWREAENI